MREILITSSVLIAVLLILRLLFRRSISSRAQYALWGLVLLRLLAPFSLPAMEHNVLSAAEPVERIAESRLGGLSIYMNPVAQGTAAMSGIDAPPVVVRDRTSEAVNEADYIVQGQSAVASVRSEDRTSITYYAKAITLAQVLTGIWYAGIAVMTAWFLFSNLRFWRRLRSGRSPYTVEGCKLPVYLMESGLPSPCLFGLFRPAIYLTPAAAASPDSLRHVIAHEETHARHLDPLWSLLRCVCLAVYWFNPLVWAAAIVSKADCELACDEGALRRLGEAERISYGKTLLSLIPVRRRPSNPLLSATTMTAEKRQLKDRITRIAENRQTAAAALLLAAVLAALACAVTFTGGREPDSGAGSSTEVRPLTVQELAWFSQDFFGSGFGTLINIRSQFLSSTYERPEDIDLLQLFYNGTGLPESMDGGERAAVVERGYQGYDPEIDLTKCSRANMDAVLTEYAGLTLQETHQVQLDAFTYLEEYDAYYFFHGDTNARAGLAFPSGEREGDLVRLYYDDSDFDLTGWKCVTLRETAEGSYQFVSNLLSDAPAMAVVLPSWEPEYAFPLSDMEPYTEPAVTVERHIHDLAELLAACPIADSCSAAFYRSTDGNIYCGLVDSQLSDFQADCFLRVDFDAWKEVLTIEAYQDILGHSGFKLTYPLSMASYVTAYYYLDGDGAPRLLFETTGNPRLSDLDGNGQRELIWEPLGAEEEAQGTYLLLQQGDALYQVHVDALVREAYPGWEYVSIETYEAENSGHYLNIGGTISVSDGGTASFLSAQRYLYFDGARLLFYKDERGVSDHLLEGVEAPPAVLTAAKAYVQEKLDWWRQNTGVQSYEDGQWQDVGEPAVWDDWRITALSYVPVRTISSKRPEIQAEIYSLGYELHTTTPQKVVAAGGMYIDEDGWVGGFSDEYRFLVFLTDRDGTLTQLDSLIAGDAGAGSPIFYAGVAETLTSAGVLQFSEINQEYLSVMFYAGATRFLNSLGKFPSNEQVAALKELVAYRDSHPTEAYRFDDPMEALWYSSSGLTEEGDAAYRRLLDISNNASEIPSTVRATAADAARQFYESARYEEAWEDVGLFNFRVESLAYAYTYRNFHDMAVEVYRMNYEFLAEYPANAPLAGGMYVTEDDWVCPTYPDSTYLFFQLQADNSRTYLYAAMENDCSPGDQLFTSDMEHRYFREMLPAIRDDEYGGEPVSHTQAEYEAAVDAVRKRLAETGQHPNVDSLEIQSIQVSEAATARVSRFYAWSRVAEESGYDSEAMTRMIAVQAIYDIQWIPSVADTAGKKGLVAETFYLLPDSAYENAWYIWDSLTSD